MLLISHQYVTINAVRLLYPVVIII